MLITLYPCRKELNFRPVKHKYEGTLTKDRIISDGGKVLKKAGYAFCIFKLLLSDKEDETDIGIDNDTHHKYYLHFKHPENGCRMTYKVNRAFYMDAVLGAEYLAAVTPANEIAAVYQATNWSVAEELKPYMPGAETADNVFPQAAQAAGTVQPEALYQTNTIQYATQPEKTQKLLPILALVLAALSYFVPIIAGVPLGIAALVLAIVGLAKQRTKLSVTSLVITAVLVLLLIVSIAVALAGAL